MEKAVQFIVEHHAEIAAMVEAQAAMIATTKDRVAVVLSPKLLLQNYPRSN